MEVSHGQINNLVIILIFDTKLCPWIRCLQSVRTKIIPCEVRVCLITCSHTSESWCMRGTHSESSMQAGG